MSDDFDKAENNELEKAFLWRSQETQNHSICLLREMRSVSFVISGSLELNFD